MPRRVLLIVASVLLAAAGTALVAAWARTQRTAADTAAAGVQVLVATREIPAGTPAGQALASTRRVTVPAAAATGALRPGDTSTGRAVTSIPAGTLLQQVLFSDAAGGDHPDLTRGAAITLQLDPPDRLGGTLRAGDLVDVFATSGRGADQSRPVLVAQAVPVLDPGDGPGGLVKLDVDPQAAGRILTAQASGGVALALLSSAPSATP